MIDSRPDKAMRAPNGDEDLDEAAGVWLQRLLDSDVGDDVVAAFEQWRKADPLHGEAFDRVAREWDTLGQHATAPELLALKRDAFLHAGRLAPTRASRARWPFAAAVASIVVLSAAAVVTYLSQPSPQAAFTTGMGERKTLTLADKSSVDMDAESALSVEFTARERRVRVENGQVYFHVAKDRARPFVVEAKGKSIVATGTEFDVETLAQGMRVTLVEGRVTVKAAAVFLGWGESQLARLVPGDAFSSEVNGAPALVHGVNVRAALAWRSGKLIFDDTPLADALATLARYSSERIAMDPALAGIRVSGVFTQRDMREFTRALKSYYPVSVVANPAGGLLLLPRR